MGGRIERIIRAPLSWAKRSPVGFRRNYRMKALFAPVVSAMDWEGRGTPALLLATGGFGLGLIRLDCRACGLYWLFQSIIRSLPKDGVQ
jgi:hypothetical protein